MIYFARNTNDGSIKIGYSADPQSRLRQLQTSSPHRLELIGAVAGNMDGEKALHERFRDYRLSGEWFRPDDGVVEKAIQQILAPPPETPGLLAWWEIVCSAIEDGPDSEDDVIEQLSDDNGYFTFYAITDSEQTPPDPEKSLSRIFPLGRITSLKSIRLLGRIVSLENGRAGEGPADGLPSRCANMTGYPMTESAVDRVTSLMLANKHRFICHVFLPESVTRIILSS